MTNEEARRILLSDSDFSGVGEKAKLTADALCVAVEALEKQIPKKPYFEADGYADGYLAYETWICPCCGKSFEVDYEEYDHCPECGQSIDWLKEEVSE